MNWSDKLFLWTGVVVVVLLAVVTCLPVVLTIARDNWARWRMRERTYRSLLAIVRHADSCRCCGDAVKADLEEMRKAAREAY